MRVYVGVAWPAILGDCGAGLGKDSKNKASDRLGDNDGHVHGLAHVHKLTTISAHNTTNPRFIKLMS